MSGIPLPKSALANFDTLLAGAPVDAIIGISALDAGKKAIERPIGEREQKQGLRMPAPANTVS